MATSTTPADDVRLEIDTGLDDPEIESLVDREERRINRTYDADDFQDDQHRADLEALLAAIRIATSHDRAEDSITTGRTSIEYGNDLLADLRRRARRLEPGDELVGGGVRRDMDRSVGSATPGGDLERE